MNILIIGGTGTISLSVTRLLVRAGWDVTLLHRGKSPAPEGVRELIADINDEAGAAGQIGGRRFDAVAQFVAYVPGQVERDFRLFGGKTGQYLFISSASAYQKPASALPITESTPLHNPYWQYSRDKAACEDLLMARYRESGFPVTVVRPSHTYDERRVPVAIHGAKGSWQVLQRIRQGKPVLVPGDGTSLWALTHSRDIAPGIAGLLGNPHAVGQAVHITSDELICWNDIYLCISKALGAEYKPAYVPSQLLAAAGAPLGYDFAGSLLGDKARSAIFDNTKIKTLVPGFCAKLRCDEGLREAVEHILAHKELQQEDPAFDTFSDRVVNAMDTARRTLTEG